MKGAWGWVILYIIWFSVEQVSLDFLQPTVDPNGPQDAKQLSVVGTIILIVALGPMQEELLFRGALFSALMRRWGLAIAVVVPSAVWGLMHIHYEPVYVASIAASGVILAIIRWKSASLYVPFALHAGGNLLDLLLSY